eukprot:jgi/Hompol1/1911/HPOL_000226-RA
MDMKDCGSGLESAALELTIYMRWRNQEAFVKQLIQDLAHSQRLEAARSRTAAKEQLNERFKAIEPDLMRRAILHSVKYRESLRAHLIANQCRRRLENSVPTVEIASQSLVRINRLKLQSEPRNYTISAIHREYAAVRCDQPRRPGESPAKTVRIAAELEQQKRADEIHKRSETLKVLDQNSKQRHSQAIKSIQMTKNKEKMVAQLGQLDLDDRHRKQKNAGLYANVFRPDHLRLGAMQLNERFVQEFNIVDSDGRLDATQHTRRAQPLRSTIPSRASSNSIEIVNRPGKTQEIIRVQPRRMVPTPAQLLDENTDPLLFYS